MGLFKADFFRALGFGFALTALGLVGAMHLDSLHSDSVMPQAVAAAAPGR